MEFIPPLLGLALAASFVGNILLYLALKSRRGAYEEARRVLVDALEKAKKTPAPTIDAEQLLHDLTRGPAVIKVEVIDAKNLLLRSPRG